MLPDGGDGVDYSVSAILLAGISARHSRCLTLSTGPEVIDEPVWRTAAIEEKSQAGTPMMQTVFVRTRHVSLLGPRMRSHHDPLR